MNLAELRKKAQKQHKEVACRMAPPSPQLNVIEEAMVEEAMLAEAAEAVVAEAVIAEAVIAEAAADPLPETDVSTVETAVEPRVPPLQAAREAHLFDPLSILLAGREAAALADEAEFTDFSTSSEAGSEAFQEFLCFKVASEIYAINIMNIKEIIKPREVTEVPRAPSFVSGVLSLRGIIIPIFNMRLRLGLAGAERSAKERIIVLKKTEEFFGVLVDEVIQVVKIASTAIEKPPVVLEGIDRDFVQGIGRYENQMLILLNQDKILDLTLC